MGGPDILLTYENNPRGGPAPFFPFIDLYCYEDLPDSEDEEPGGPDSPPPVASTGTPGVTDGANAAETRGGGGIGGAAVNDSQDGK